VEAARNHHVDQTDLPLLVDGVFEVSLSFGGLPVFDLEATQIREHFDVAVGAERGPGGGVLQAH
jgi:hypothetical protein